MVRSNPEVMKTQRSPLTQSGERSRRMIARPDPRVAIRMRAEPDAPPYGSLIVMY